MWVRWSGARLKNMAHCDCILQHDTFLLKPCLAQDGCGGPTPLAWLLPRWSLEASRAWRSRAPEIAYRSLVRAAIGSGGRRGHCAQVAAKFGRWVRCCWPDQIHRIAASFCRCHCACDVSRRHAQQLSPHILEQGGPFPCANGVTCSLMFLNWQNQLAPNTDVVRL